MSSRNGKHRQPIKHHGNAGAFSKFTKNKEKDADEDMGEGRQGRQQQSPHRIMITGFPMETRKEALLSCLQNALKVPLTPAQFSVDNKHAVLQVHKRVEANALLNLSGIKFNNTKLTILSLKNGKLPPAQAEKKHEKQRKDKTKEDKMLLEIFVQQIYDHANHALDLGDLEHRVSKVNVNFLSGAFVETLLRILKDKTPNVSTINFANNKISMLVGFEKAKSLGLDLLNLSFDQNQIKNVDNIRYLRGLNLRELVLTNNPISQKIEPFEYRKKIARALPNLQLIDGYDIKLNSYLPIRTSYCDTPVTQSFADDFVNRFVDLCDNNRSSLIHAYADNAIFSITSSVKNKVLTSTIFYERNLAQKASFEKRVENLLIGKQRVVKELCVLFPDFQHKREGMVVDAFMVKGINNVDLITINMNGDWLENKNTRVTYNRTLLLAPAPPNSSALVNGFQAVIINDILHVSQPKRFPIVNTSATSVPISIAGPSSTTVPTLNNIVLQQQMVIRFSEQTAMNLTFSEQCLNSNQWDYEKSLINFSELKSTNAVPPEAFIK